MPHIQGLNDLRKDAAERYRPSCYDCFWWRKLRPSLDRRKRLRHTSILRTSGSMTACSETWSELS